MIRKAATEDIPAIRAMAQMVFRETYRDILSPQQMEYMMEMMYSVRSLENQFREGVFFVCAQEGALGEQLVGYASVRPDGCTSKKIPRYHLEKLYVLPSYQKRGFGRLLFEEVCSYVRGKDSPALLELNVNRSNPAIGFYEHLGLRRSRSGDFPIGCGFFMNDHIMSINL